MYDVERYRLKCNRRQFLYGGLAVALLPYGTAQAAVENSVSKFEKALSKLQNGPALANSFIANDEPVIAFKTGPEKAPIRAPKSERQISSRAFDLIVASEVSSQQAYRSRYENPVWPFGQSGVTIGIGYDIGACTRTFLKEDWGSYLDSSSLEQLTRACGVSGKGAAALVPDLKTVRISWDLALSQYRLETLPRYIGETERALQNTSALGPDCLGALVSLVYNRGASFQDPAPRFSEMRELSGNMSSKKFRSIPQNIRAMERLWKADRRYKGIVIRREAEAALFELGLETDPPQEN